MAHPDWELSRFNISHRILNAAPTPSAPRSGLAAYVFDLADDPLSGIGLSWLNPSCCPCGMRRDFPADAVPVLISYFDANHICRFANEHHNQWYGRSPAELVGLHMRDFLGEVAYQTRLPYLDLVAQGECVSLEAEVPHWSGVWRDAAIRYIPLMGARGFEGFHTLVFDLSREQHRFHSIFDGTAVGFWEIDLTPVRAFVADLEGRVPDLKALIANDLGLVRRVLDVTPVLAMNEKASQVLGVDPREAAGRMMGWWCPDASLEVWNEVFLGYLAGKAAFEGETLMRREDGSLFNVLISAAYPKNREEHVIVVVGLVDISERVAREQALAKAQHDLAHAARVSMLGEMVASITHEVNQPLAAVVTSGHAALRWLARGEPDVAEARLAIRQLIGEAERAAHIIHRTRQMAFKDTGEAKAFDLPAMLREAVEITRSQVKGLGARLALDIGGAAGEMMGDRIQLQQVVINLIVNAAQAMAEMPEGARQIVLHAQCGEASVSIRVEDEGPASARSLRTGCSRPFSPPRRAAWAWGSRSRRASWRAMVERLRHGPALKAAQSFRSACLLYHCCPKSHRRHDGQAI
jgi:PAS domain S-box-containing protein